MSKKYLQENVFDAAVKRIDWVLDNFPAYYVSFSGGKDSGALLNLVIERARAKNKLPVPTMFFDWETNYQETINFVERMLLNSEIEPYWICLPECEDNGSSIFERFWKPWDPAKKDKWIRPMPIHKCVINLDNMPMEWNEWYDPDAYSLWIVKKFGDWLAAKKRVDRIANFIGMRTTESYGRHMLIASAKHRKKLNKYTYQTVESGEKTWIAMPLYDWEIPDVWHACAERKWDYNKVYDKMYWMGKSIHDMRICNAFGEVQKKDLENWQIIEPETWDKLVERVQGANYGAIYNKTNLNSMKTTKPDNLTWEQYTWLLFDSLPPEAQENYRYRFDVIFRWFETYSIRKLGLERYMFDTKKEAKQFAQDKDISIAYVGSWETLANFIIKRDWICKKYGFAESKRTDDSLKRLFEKYKDL